MARIAGIDLPRNKKVEFALPYIYGIGHTQSKKILESKPIKMTRLARGLPVGSHLEYVDEATLARSINERVELHS